MTSETIDVPAPVRAVPPPYPGLWLRTLGRSVLVPLAVPAAAGVPFRPVPLAAAVLLTVVAVLFAECLVNRGLLFEQAPSRLAALTPFAAGAMTLSGGTYVLSTAIVLGVAAAACRVDRDRRRLGRRRAVLLVLGGAALAVGDQVVHLALPLATVAVAARGTVVLIGRRRQVATGAPARALGLLWLGFLPVVPVARTVDLPGSGGTLGAGPSGPALLLAVAVLGWLAHRAARDLPYLARPDRLQVGGLTVAAVALLAAGAAVGAPAVAAAGGALLLAVLGYAVLTRRR
jgi:hypothetical protein